MKKILLGMIICMALIISAGNAFAVPVTLSLDGLWDWGTNYSFDGTNWTAVTANPYFGTTGQSFVNGVAKTPDGNEDSFGIMRVNSIIGGGSTIFDRSTAAYELTVFYYGFDDVYLDGTLSSATIFSQGGRIVVYRDYSKNYDPANPLNPGTGRYNITPGVGDGFTTITDGELVLDLSARLVVDPGTGVNYTMNNTFNFVSQGGGGQILLDVVGGSWAQDWDTNTQDYGTDMKLTFTSFANSGYNGWVVNGVASGPGNVVPEPASMVMMGLGMLGLGFVRRKRA